MNRHLLGSFLFGVGLVGMLDGIVFHQLLQWHSVYMPTDRPRQIVSDGVFHLIVTTIIFIGGILMWKTNPDKLAHPNRVLWGGFFLGAGTFNLVEGILSHHVLKIHHILPGSPHQLLYDLMYDASGVLMIIIGWLIYRSAKKQPVSTT